MINRILEYYSRMRFYDYTKIEGYAIAHGKAATAAPAAHLQRTCGAPAAQIAQLRPDSDGPQGKGIFGAQAE